MTIEQVKNYCLSLENTFLDTPFDFETVVIRHKDNNKIFVLFCSPNERPSINLKCEPSEAEFLRSVYKDVIPGYHMNKTHWNTVYLDGDVPEKEIKSMIDSSYDLTKPKRKKKKQLN